jgi:hypothetical protein
MVVLGGGNMFFSNGPMMDTMFTVVPMFIMVIFIVVFTLVIFAFVKGIGQWRNNNSQPILTVNAKVSSKRADATSTMHNSHWDNRFHHRSTHTTYFVTFEVESGDRIEFLVDGSEYGVLADNDIGKLTFQGTRFLGFVRNLSSNI